jgi:hypothetical protein
MEEPIKIFFCYAREDDVLRQGLEKQLRALKRQGIIDIWYDREINAGTEWKKEIDKHLNSAQIILLLVSPDFMDSDYCYSIEMKRAMERHERGEARVIPIILRPVYWQAALFSKLQVLPTDGKPLTDRNWHTLDEAFFNVAEGIRAAIDTRTASTDHNTTPAVARPRVSRRAILLAGGAILISGGAIWFASSQRRNANQSTPMSTPKPTPTSTPLGTTFVTYRGHSESVLALAWSPSGKYIVSAGGNNLVGATSNDNTVQVWDAVTGTHSITYKGHSAVHWSIRR